MDAGEDMLEEALKETRSPGTAHGAHGKYVNAAIGGVEPSTKEK